MVSLPEKYGVGRQQAESNQQIGVAGRLRLGPQPPPLMDGART